MPELPDITLYLEALEKRILGKQLDQVRISNPFLLRTVLPPLDSVAGHKIVALRRMGKRIIFGFDSGAWLVLHLMIAGRLHWGARNLKIPRKMGLAAFDFENGTLLLTESSSSKRASLHLFAGEEELALMDPGGLEPLQCSAEQFGRALTKANHTLKRALTDPHLFSGIGNAYSDEILHAAKLSPIALTQKLTPEERDRLYIATRDTLGRWLRLLRAQLGENFPENVTAFRPEMAVHGKFRCPCLVCGAKVQRIRYAENETNYCPNCQTGGRLLADRSLSLLLKKDWPRRPEELEDLRRPRS